IARSYASPQTHPLTVNHATANHAITTQIPTPSYALAQTPTSPPNHATTSPDRTPAPAQCNGIDPNQTESPTIQPRLPPARLAVGSHRGSPEVPRERTGHGRHDHPHHALRSVRPEAGDAAALRRPGPRPQ